MNNEIIGKIKLIQDLENSLKEKKHELKEKKNQLKPLKDKVCTILDNSNNKKIKYKHFKINKVLKKYERRPTISDTYRAIQMTLGEDACKKIKEELKNKNINNINIKNTIYLKNKNTINKIQKSFHRFEKRRKSTKESSNV